MAQAVMARADAPVPPQNLDAEESVLGGMMLSPSAIAAVSEVLGGDGREFYRESHAKMYRAALALYAKGEPVDAITLTDELDERGELEDVGGKVRVHELAALVPASANAGHYAQIVRETAVLRGLIRAGGEIARLGWERPGETTDLLDKAEQVLFDLSQQRAQGEFSHIEQLLKESFERITALYESGADVTGVPSGFRDLDRITSGFQEGNLIILAARPSMGKSALGLCIAANLAVRQRTPVALFTLEMSKAEVTQRLMCSEAKVESQRLRTGKLSADDWPRLTTACDKLAKAPIYVDDSGSITMMEIRSKARRLKSKHPELGLLIVDYIQLMTTGQSVENRVQEVSQISRSLKVLARDLGVPIVALSQLSRAVEQRHDKRPILSDLRESGCLTGDTRVYLPEQGIYRPIRDLAGMSGFDVLAVNTDTWRLESRRVVRAFSTGRKPVYRLTTRLGRTIRATGNHKFLAFYGWRRLDDLFPGLRIALPRQLSGPTSQMMSDSELGHLEALDGRAREKRVPDAVFAQPAAGIARFLNHLWATGGCIRAGGGREAPVIRFDSRSEELAKGVASLLLRLGITAERCRVPRPGKGRDGHRVDVVGEEDVRRFVTLVGGVGDRNGVADAGIPKEACRMLVGPALAPACVSGRQVRERIETPYRGSGRSRRGLVRERRPRVPAAVESDALTLNDVYWDEVTSIEPAGEEEVFDLTVDGLHNFVADDVIVHNSIEQDADIVCFIYRDEYYNGEESDQQGLAEVHVAKHRNGPTDTVKLSFLKRYAKFADLAAV
ncbi:MAG: replicative DNA helicase [Gaiellaceae bacterium]